jgi:hypothetical protein
MNTQKETSRTDNRPGTRSSNRQKPIRDATKEKWLQKHAGRVLAVWSQWQSPLGVAPAYATYIRTDLAAFYDDPLKRMFIEASY